VIDLALKQRHGPSIAMRLKNISELLFGVAIGIVLTHYLMLLQRAAAPASSHYNNLEVPRSWSSSATDPSLSSLERYHERPYGGRAGWRYVSCLPGSHLEKLLTTKKADTNGLESQMSSLFRHFERPSWPRYDWSFTANCSMPQRGEFAPAPREGGRLAPASRTTASRMTRAPRPTGQVTGACPLRNGRGGRWLVVGGAPEVWVPPSCEEDAANPTPRWIDTEEVLDCLRGRVLVFKGNRWRGEGRLPRPY
jgi:hypothetical protein